MFNGILSDVIGREGHVSGTGNGNKNNKRNTSGGGGGGSGGGGDSRAERFRDRATQDFASMVGVFERHVTHYHNHVLHMRDSVAVTSSSTDALQSVSCQEVGIPTDFETSTSVSCVICCISYPRR